MSDQAGLLFLSWVRDGLAGSLQSTAGHALPTVTIKATVNAFDENEQPLLPAEPREIHVDVYGPGHVTGVSPGQIIRVQPEAGSTTFEPHLFSFVEFDRPDFPWMFTPLVPEGVKLTPWLCLIVTTAEPQAKPGAPLPVITVPPTEPLPDLADAWAWAHAQIAQTGTEPVGTLLAGRPEATLSRLLAPRRLAAQTAYHACLVPTFEAGRQAGLGLLLTIPASSAEPAWKKKRTSGLDLPVYYSWAFTTSAGGSFEALAARLDRRALKELGLRRIDLSAVTADNATGYAEGALRSLDAVPPDEWTSGQRRSFEDLVAGQLTSMKQLPPPLYGSAQAGLGKSRPGPRGRPHWLTELAYDPVQRLAAGLGTQVIQRDQEALMIEAWDQARLVPANQVIAQVQLGRAVQGAGLAKRCPPLGTFAAPALLGLARPVLDKPPADRVLNVVTSPLFRRMARPLGPLARRLPPPAARYAATPAGLPEPTVQPLAAPPSGAACLPGTAGELATAITQPDPAQPAWARPARPTWARGHPLGSLSNVVVAAFQRQAMDYFVRVQVGWQTGPLGSVQAGWSGSVGVLGHGQRNGVLQAAAIASAKTQDDGSPVFPDLLVFWAEKPQIIGQDASCQGKFFFLNDIHYDGRPSGSWFQHPGDLQTSAVSAVALAAVGSSTAEAPYLDAVFALWVDAERRVRYRVGRYSRHPTALSWGDVRDAFRVDAGLKVRAAAALLSGVAVDGGIDLHVALLVERGGGQGDLIIALGRDVDVRTGKARAWTTPWQGILGSGLPGGPAAMAFTDLSGSTAPDLVICFTNPPSTRGDTQIVWDITPAGSTLWRSVSTRPGECQIPSDQGLEAIALTHADLSILVQDQRTSAYKALQAAASARLLWWQGLASPPANSPRASRRLAGRTGRKLKAVHALEPAARSKRLLRRTTIDARPGRWTGLSDRQRLTPAAPAGNVWSVTGRDKEDPQPGPLLAAPRFDRPMYEALQELPGELLLPGLSTIQDESVGLLAANPVFVDAFLVGLNHEMTRELLWRGYRTDPAATYFRRFWDSSASGAVQEIPPISTWGECQPLGAASSGQVPLLALVLRGELLRRFPRVNVYAQQAAADGTHDPAKNRLPWAVHASLPPDTLLLGFQIPLQDALGPPGYYFVFEQEPTGVTFGLDEDSAGDGAAPKRWADLRWGQTGTEIGSYLSMTTAGQYMQAQAGIPAGQPLTLPVNDAEGSLHPYPITWAAGSASMAHITIRSPIHYVIHANKLIPAGAHAGWQVTAVAWEGPMIRQVGGQQAAGGFWALSASQADWLARRGSPVHLLDGTPIPITAEADGTPRFPQPGEPVYDQLRALAILPATPKS